MISQCWLNFASPLYSRILLITCHHWFKWRFGCKQAQSHYIFHLWCSSLIHVSIVKLRGVNMRRHVTLPRKCGLCTCCHLLALNICLNNGWWIPHDGAEMVKDIIKLIFEQQVNDLMQKGHIVDAYAMGIRWLSINFYGIVQSSPIIMLLSMVYGHRMTRNSKSRMNHVDKQTHQIYDSIRCFFLMPNLVQFCDTIITLDVP